MHKAGVVFDTNVIISHLLFSGSVSDKAVWKALGSDRILVSHATLAELGDVLMRSKFGTYLPIAVRHSAHIQFGFVTETVIIRHFIQACRDPKDNKFLDVAVTGDADLLDLHPFQGINILTPADYLSRS